MLLALLISFSYRFLVNLSAFWVQNAIGLSRFGFFLPLFLSGFIMPLRFMPEWFTRIVWLTPFPYSVTTIVDIYLGLVQGPELYRALGMQFFWVIILYALCQAVLRLGLRRLVILGG